ncbi:MAG: IMPACT family protein [Candidatus Cloacimonetes bacterium]|nr:IMPACT family protein [Candidatus Cloacimonadota bacterium]
MFTIEKEVEYEEHIKKSHFIGNLLKCTTPEEAKTLINSIASRYREATHNCWAYRTGLNGELSHCSDAGEPSGTAGKPIMGAIHKHELSNVVLVVTRYFGGVKLGIRGLIDAYRHIAEETINKATLKEMILKDYWEIKTDYAHADKIKHAINELSAEIISADYQEEVTIYANTIANSGLKEFLQSNQDAGLLKYRLLKTEL